MNPTLQTYGAPSGSDPSRVRWDLAPNPGGAPALGNATFTLTSATTMPTPWNLWLIGFDRANVTVPIPPPIDLLVNPAVSISVGNGSAPGGPSSLALAIPADPQLRGLVLYVQCIDYYRSFFNASSGLRVTIH